MIGRLIVALLFAHDLHTTMTEVVVDPRRHVVHATIRAFSDDLARAAGMRTPLDYVRATFRLQDRAGHALPLRSCGEKRDAGLVWICVEADVGASTDGLMLGNALLTELYRDQVNIVRATDSRGTRSALFTRGDRVKGIL